MFSSPSAPQPPNGSMTEDITYDDLYARYENAKHLLKEIRTSFNGSFQGVRAIIQQYATSVNAEFINDLSSILNDTKTSLETLFTATTDPGLFEPTRLEQKMNAYQIERKQGIEMVTNLRSQIESLQEEKRNWSIREEKGKKLIEQYQIQLQQDNKNKNGTYNNNNNNNSTTVINTNSSSVDDYYDGNTNVPALKKQITTLLSDKGRLEEQLFVYKKRLSASGGNIKQLYRKDSVTEWNEDDLSAMKEEMRLELLTQHQAALDAQFEKQFALRTEIMLQQEENEIKNDIKNDIKPDNTTNDNDNDNDNNNTLAPTTPSNRAFRHGTKTSWDDSELAELKRHMKDEMQIMATQEKQKQIAKMAERNDAIRDPSELFSADLLIPHGYGDTQIDNSVKEEKEEKQDQDNADMMQQMKEMQMQEKKAKLLAMAERGDLIRDSQTNINELRDKEKEERDVEDIQAEIERINKQNIAARSKKNYDLVTAASTDVVNTKVMVQVEDMDEAKAMEQHMIDLRKQQLLHDTEPYGNPNTPQINKQHKALFDMLMKEIGIVDPHNQQRLWDGIEMTVNQDKKQQFGRGHSITASSASMLSDRDNSINNLNAVANFEKEMKEDEINELKQLLVDKTQELERVSEELERVKNENENVEVDEDNSDLGILDTGITTLDGSGVGMGLNDENDVDLMDEMNELKGKINELSVKNERLNVMNDKNNNKFDIMNDEIYDLNEEVKRISKSKILLLQNTSKEIDSLRKLLSDYVKLANQQKNKFLK